MGFNVEVKDKDLGWKALLERVKQLAADKTYVKAGVLSAKGAQEHPSHGEAKHITNVQLAVIHEFGAPSAGIPERSFLRSTFHEKRAAYREMLGKLLKNSVVKGKEDLFHSFALVGQKLSADIKGKFTEGEGIAPPLAAETIARKGSSRPLVDTGTLKNSITYAVVKGKGT